MGLQVMVSLIRGKNGTTAHELIDFWEEHLGRRVPDDVRVSIEGQLEPYAEILNHARGLPDFLEDEAILNELRQREDPAAATAAPGKFMQKVLAGAKRRNVERKTKRSDVIDCTTSSSFPTLISSPLTVKTSRS